MAFSDFSDNFNRANANPIGSPWAAGDNGASVTDLQINGNQVRPGGGTASITMSYYTTESAVDDCVLELELARIPSGSQRYGLGARIQSAGGASSGYYCWYRNNSGAPTIEIGKWARSGTN